MNAADVKDALRRRHPARMPASTMPGAWTCIEEWRNIDLLAVSAWASVRPYPRYARVGYEVKVSRADYRRELAKPSKRSAAVAFCHEFYFAIPDGLLKPDEIAYVAPDWLSKGRPFERPHCPGAFGTFCINGRIVLGRGEIRSRHGRERYFGDLDWVERRARLDAARSVAPTSHPSWHDRRSLTYSAECPTCRGAGWLIESPAVLAGAPKLWVPADVGLLTVAAGGATRIVKKAPRRAPIANGGWPMTDHGFAELVRWVSVRPDPRHRAQADT